FSEGKYPAGSESWRNVRPYVDSGEAGDVIGATYVEGFAGGPAMLRAESATGAVRTSMTFGPPQAARPTTASRPSARILIRACRRRWRAADAGMPLGQRCSATRPMPSASRPHGSPDQR